MEHTHTCNTHTRKIVGLFAKSGLVLIAALLPALVQAAEINIYSARQENLIRPLLDQFSERHKIQVNLVTGKADALLARLNSEGENTPADLLLTTDVGRLHQAKAAGLLRAVRSPILSRRIPAQFRDPDNHWFGLSLRARVIMASRQRVGSGAITNYEQLAGPEWRGKICVRSSSNIYNQSLVASMIAHSGKDAALSWARGLAANFARPPTGGDRDQILAVAGGLCDVAVANTYYLALMQHGNDDAQREAANSVRVVWPNQNGRGTHVNISGAGLTAAAKNREHAIMLLEFLVGDEAQHWYAESNYEFPVVDSVEAARALRDWGQFRRDDIPLARFGELNTEAVRLMDQAGWK